MRKKKKEVWANITESWEGRGRKEKKRKDEKSTKEWTFLKSPSGILHFLFFFFSSKPLLNLKYESKAKKKKENYFPMPLVKSIEYERSHFKQKDVTETKKKGNSFQLFLIVKSFFFVKIKTSFWLSFRCIKLFFVLFPSYFEIPSFFFT